MTRRTRGSARSQDDEEDDADTQSPSSRRRRVSRYQSDSENDDNEDGDDELTLTLTQQAPELSQPMPSVRTNERTNLESMGRENKQKALTDLSRLVLFKALAGEPIDRLKCVKEVSINSSKITSAAFDEVAVRLRNVFGFDLGRVPKYMEDNKNFPKKFKDRLYVTNTVDDDESGNHSKAIHAVHSSSAVEKGFLMVVLAFIYCKGFLKGGVRWITDAELYRLLHALDESLPSQPPSVTGKRSTSVSSDGSSPNPDVLLDEFVRMDYLLKDKSGEKTESQRGEKDEMKTNYC